MLVSSSDTPRPCLPNASDTESPLATASLSPRMNLLTAPCVSSESCFNAEAKLIPEWRRCPSS